jgi:diguanylate cyclase (GGDEF)-like protein
MSRHSRTITAFVRSRILLVTAVLVIALAVWAAADQQHKAADHVFEESRAAQRLFTAMLDQQTGVRGFALTRQDEFLEPYLTGMLDFEDAVNDSGRLTHEHMRTLIDREVAAARAWQRLAEQGVARMRAEPGLAAANSGVEVRKQAFDRFRAENTAVQQELAREKTRELNRAELISLTLVLGLGTLFGVIGYLAIGRGAAKEKRRRERERRYRASQTEFAETMQVMRDEREAYDLVKRHLERTIAGGEVTVLNRNNSDNRLVPVTAGAGDGQIGERLTAASSQACMAVRQGRKYERGTGSDPLLTCDLCGDSAPEIVCVPELVGGEVIGAVLVRHQRPLDEEDKARVSESVAQSAPVLANLRTLAMAETRAATDALTGLPNSRACQDTVKRMTAQAGRAGAVLTAVMLDLDHFKQINDRFGHGAGDDALAAAASAITASLRTSDFAGRYGGEEFLLLLPETDTTGAMEVAEKIRAVISQIQIPTVDREITASLGVATYPHDAGDAEMLLRKADQALYAAKAAGRNQVAVASQGKERVALEA